MASQAPEGYDSIVRSATRESEVGNKSRPTSAGHSFSNSMFRTISSATNLSRKKSRRVYEEAEDDEPSMLLFFIPKNLASSPCLIELQ